VRGSRSAAPRGSRGGPRFLAGSRGQLTKPEGPIGVYSVSAPTGESWGLTGNPPARKPASLSHSFPPLPQRPALVMKGSPVRVQASTLIDHTSRITSPRSYTVIFQLGGALARVAQEATACPQRDAAFNMNINAVWLEDDPRADEAHSLGARLLRRRRAACRRTRVRQLPRRRGRRARPRGLRRA
jgi:hypothetical protein